MSEPDQIDSSARTRIFFLHVMKTGGTTLTKQFWRQFAPERIYGGYGSAEDNHIIYIYRYLNPRPLAQLGPETIARFEAFGGHYPYAARSLMGDPLLTLTVMRDPVDRVISFLKHAQRYQPEHRDLTLEEIYEDHWYFTRFFDNHEVKLFSMTMTEMLAHSAADGWDEEGWTESQQALLRRWREDSNSLTDGERLEFRELVAPLSDTRAVHRLLGAPNTAEVEVDEARLRRAIENLESVDIIGLFEDYEGFMKVVSSRLGFHLDSRVRLNVGGSHTVSKALRARIASQNAPSLELYEAARKIATERQAGRPAVR